MEWSVESGWIAGSVVSDAWKQLVERTSMSPRGMGQVNSLGVVLHTSWKKQVPRVSLIQGTRTYGIKICFSRTTEAEINNKLFPSMVIKEY